MTYEELQSEHDYLNIKEMDLSEINGLKGLYIDGNIAIQEGMTSTEKSCILAEELGHHHTSSGNILDLHNVGSRKQEQKARLWAYDKQIGFLGLIRAYEQGCRTQHEVADFLGITEEFLLEAIDCYKSKYGEFVDIDAYVIRFIPNFGVAKLF